MSDLLQLVVVSAKKLAADESGKTQPRPKQTEQGHSNFPISGCLIRVSCG